MERATASPGRPPLLLWIGLPAVLGFAAGFLGPVVLNPEANQGPLLGIFITGPGGSALGLLLGAVARLLRLSPVHQWRLLMVACAALVVLTLVASLPGPRLIGYVVDAELRACSPPSQSLDRAMSHWETRLAGTDARPGWQQEARVSAAIDPGVVLELNVARRFGIYQHRKPWNKGRLMARSRRTPDATQRYYARYGGGSCDAYPVGTRVLYYATTSRPPGGPVARQWPPTSDVAAFLGLSVVVPATDEHRHMIEGRVDPKRLTSQRTLPDADE